MDLQHIEYEKLVDFAAGDLIDVDAQTVALHIAACRQCSQTVTRFKTVRSLMSADETFAPASETIARASAIYTNALARLQHVPYEKRVAFAIGDLPPDQVKTVSAHIADCAECSQTISHFRTIYGLMYLDDSQVPPATLMAQTYNLFAPSLPSPLHVAYEKLIAFAANALGAPESEKIAKHIAACAECAKTVTRFGTIRSLMQADDVPVPSSTIIARAHNIFSQSPVPQHMTFETLINFAAGDLPDALAQVVEIHIADCAECMRTIKRYQAFQALVRADDSRAPSALTVARARAIFKRPPKKEIPFWQRISLPIPLPTVRQFSTAMLIVLLILSNVVLYAGAANLASSSQDAIPGDGLYATKLGFENLQLATTWDTAGKLNRHVTYAGLRVNEAAALVLIDRLSELPSTLAAFETQVNLVSSTFATLARQNVTRARALAPEIETSISHYAVQLDTVRQTASTAVQPLFERAIQVSNSTKATVHETSLPKPTATRYVPSITPTWTTTLSPTPAPIVTSAPARATSAPTSRPAGVRSPTSARVPTSAPVPPASVNTPTVMPSRIIIITQPTKPPTPFISHTPQPTITPQPTPTREPTKVPPGQQKKTETPTPKRSKD